MTSLLCSIILNTCLQKGDTVEYRYKEWVVFEIQGDEAWLDYHGLQIKAPIREVRKKD